MGRKNIRFDLGIPVKVDICLLNKGDAQYVYHNALLIMLVLEGEIHVQRMNASAAHKKNDICVIDSLCPYEVKSCQDNTKVLLFYIDVSYYKQLYPYIDTTIFLSDITSAVEDREVINEVRTMVLEVSLALMRDDFKGFKEIEYTMSRLLRMILDCFQLFSPGIEKLFNNDAEYCLRMQSIYEYMYEKTDETLSLSDLSEAQHLSTHYLSHFMKDVNGMGFREIFEFFRVRKAEMLLSTHSYKASEVARAVGFSATKYYKKYFELFYNEDFDTFCLRKSDDSRYVQFKECSKPDKYRIIRDYIEIMQLHIKSKGIEINEIVEINVEKSFGRFHNPLGFEGTMTNIKSNLSPDARAAVLDIKEKFKLTGVYIYLSKIFSAEAEDDGYMIVSENINYLIKSGFEVICVFDQTNKPILKKFLRFLRFYLSRFRGTVNNIFYEISNENGDYFAGDFEEELKRSMKEITGRPPLIKTREDQGTYLELLDYIYDSFFISPFAIDELLHLDQWKVSLNFALIDPVRPDGNILGGGYGLITWNGIKKPWWYAYEFISHMRGEILGQGEDYIATKEGGQINLLIYNKCNYDAAKLRQIHSKEQLFEVISHDGLFKKHTIFLRGLNGNYKVAKYSLNQHSCLFSKWAELGFPQYLSEDEEKAFSLTCHPDISMKRMNARDNIELNILQPTFGVTLIMIEAAEN